LHGGFTLDDARRLVPYLASLGVTDCYCSPIFKATAGSTHGYDISSHTEINPELGGEAAFTAFCDALAEHGLGLILDFVPNHMSNNPETNEWWRDVLENGPSSPFAGYFDIDWQPTKPELKDRLLLPILGDQYGDTLLRGELTLRYDRGALVLDYGSLVLPTNPRPAALVFGHDLDVLEAELDAESSDLREFLSILTALTNLPAYTERDARRIQERQREKGVARDRLDRLAQVVPAIGAHLERAIAAYNGTPGEPRSFDRLHALLEQQPYRLASWRTASDEINYRRFFDINELAGLRVEDPRVFDEIHKLVLAEVSSGRVTGVRLDHIDGLFDPKAYLDELRAALAAAAGPGTSPTYVVVEKILSEGEALRQEWAAAGTTGYGFLNDVNGVFVDASHARQLLRTYRSFTAETATLAHVIRDSKRLIVSTALSSEFHVLVQAINRISESDRRSRDFTLGSIGRALREVVACFPVYRTYVAGQGATDDDAEVVDAAIAEARLRNPAMESSIFAFLRGILVPAAPTSSPVDPAALARLELARRFQQYTAPVQAKGLEDTAFYRYHALVSVNEVGGDPQRLGRSVAAFHDTNLHRLRHWPGDMLATTTHDTKRSEDARARINVLSEMPAVWAAAAARWRRINAPNRTRLPGGQAPDANDEYLFYQALLGVWPIGLDASNPDLPTDLVPRLTAYMHKATKEAKRHTSWITPNPDYETAVARFIERSLTGRTSRAFFAAFLPLVDRVASAGMVNSLSQLVLKIASPGVADFYQGVELWDQSLVDPDNRRPVDFAIRQQMLAGLEPLLAAGRAAGEIAPGGAAALLEQWTDGRIKMLITALGMRLRRQQPHLFLDGAYRPLGAEGAAAAHVIAFQRDLAGDALIVVVPRLVTRLSPREWPVGESIWRETVVRLPDGPAPRYRNLLTGERVIPAITADGATLALGDVLRVLPVALLWAESTTSPA